MIALFRFLKRIAMRLFKINKWLVVNDKLNFIIHQNKVIMENYESLKARVDKIIADNLQIKSNIAAIRASLPASGGLTADEVVKLSADLDGAVASSDAEVADSAPATEQAPQ